jgi:hypothetical protein
MYNSITNKKRSLIMEIAQLNNNNGLYDISNYAVENPNRIEKTSQTDIKDVVDVEKVQDTAKLPSEFVINVQNNLSQLADMETAQKNVEQQLAINSTIVQVVSDAINSELPSENLDAIQPQIEELISSYNKLSSRNSTIERVSGIIEEKNDDSSRTYFDGELGSKPLSPNEIFDATQKQQEILTMVKTDIDSEFSKVVQNTQTSIDSEKKVTQERQVEFKVVNFGQESAQFNNTSLTNVEGSIVLAQPNASQEQSLRLLV